MLSDTVGQHRRPGRWWGRFRPGNPLHQIHERAKQQVLSAGEALPEGRVWNSLPPRCRPYCLQARPNSRKHISWRYWKNAILHSPDYSIAWNKLQELFRNRWSVCMICFCRVPMFTFSATWKERKRTRTIRTACASTSRVNSGVWVSRSSGKPFRHTKAYRFCL